MPLLKANQSFVYILHNFYNFAARNPLKFMYHSSFYTEKHDSCR
jgi:hypothetical protein